MRYRRPVNPIFTTKPPLTSDRVSAGMKCPVCENYRGDRAQVKAHICGSPDELHAPYIGLSEQNEPIVRGESGSTRKGTSEPASKLTSETDTETNESDTAGVALAGLAALAVSERFRNEDRERGRI